MKQEFQYAIELQLFDDQIIFNYYGMVVTLLQFSVDKLCFLCVLLCVLCVLCIWAKCLK